VAASRVGTPRSSSPTSLVPSSSTSSLKLSREEETESEESNLSLASDEDDSGGHKGEAGRQAGRVSWGSSSWPSF
jgi:hypothetical protein